MMDYWRECVNCMLEEAGITATTDQITIMTDVVEGAYENYGQAFYVPENPLISENDKLQRLLIAERNKVHCKECNGRGRIYSQGPHHGSDTMCHKCRGEGRV